MRAVPTVFVVDDDAPARQSLSVMIQTAGLLVETYDNAPELLDEYDTVRPGCLVVELSMPGMSGLSLIETLRARAVELPVIMISGCADVHSAVEAMKFGALDFLEKPFTAERLMDAIRRAIRLDASKREKRARTADAARRFENLTPREHQVLALVLAGKSNKLIAEALKISPKTVEIHRSNVMTKMAADSLANLVRMTVELAAE